MRYTKDLETVDRVLGSDDMPGSFYVGVKNEQVFMYKGGLVADAREQTQQTSEAHQHATNPLLGPICLTLLAALVAAVLVRRLFGGPEIRRSKI